MATWRTKACELFAARSGSFSFKQGVVDVAEALYDELSRAISEGDDELSGRVFDYALWAETQTNAGHLRSAVDSLFFMKLFRDPEMEAMAVKYLPEEVVSAKRRMAAGVIVDETD